MSISAIPPSGLILHGLPHADASSKLQPQPAILFKLSDDLLEDVKKASTMAGGLQLVTGTTPKIRLGKRTIDLTISPEAFEHELFSAASESLTALTFAGIVGHRAELKVPERKQSVGSDAALAALQRNLASYHQEKAAKSVTVSSSLIGTPRNRFEANRDQKYAHRRGLPGSQHPSPSLSASGTPRLGGAPTSVPSNDPTLRLKAMRKPLIHLLAIRPLSRDEIMKQTRIPKADLEEILSKIGKLDGQKTGLSDRAYKELDVWSFAYSTQEERQAAIDNAVKAYDRQRIGKEEKIWQMLLPEDRRDRGEYLSKLQLGAPANLTPNVGASPMPRADSEEKVGSVAGTPRLGAGTPKVGAGKSDLMKKLAKNPKQRAIDDAKEKKRKEREAAKADSDREGRPVKKARTTTVKTNPKVKSAELVQSSSEDETADARGSGTNSNSQPKSAPTKKREPTTNASAKTKSKPIVAASVSSSDITTGKRTQSKSTPLAKAKAASPAARPSTSASSTTKSKPTPLGKNTPSSQQRSQLSPNKPHHRPSARSPLGAARPRVASDVSDRAAVGVQRSRYGADTPKGLGISNINGIRKRHDTITSTSTDSSSPSDRMNGERVTNEKSQKSIPNGNSTGSSSSSLANVVKRKVDGAVKRKVMDSPQHENAGHAVKHRKTASSSSHSQNSVSAGSSTNSDNGRLTPARGGNIRMSFVQGVDLAQKFREELYPAYAKLYDDLEAIQKRGDVIPSAEKDRLWRMHRRLEQVKREINDASAREHED